MKILSVCPISLATAIRLVAVLGITLTLPGCDKITYTPPKYPDETYLRAVFKKEKSKFETLKMMSDDDWFDPFQVNQTEANSFGLQPARINAYRRVLNSITPNKSLLRDGDRIIKVIFDSSSGSTIANDEWSNGIAYVPPESERYCHFVDKASDIDLKAGDIYFIRLEDHWFIFQGQYQ